MGLAHQQISLDVNENYEGWDPREVAERLAIRKSKSYDVLKPGELLITADTTVVLDNQVLNKPKDKQEARIMLQSISGKMHEVISGVCLRSTKDELSFSQSSKVHFADLSQAEIEYYVQQYKPLDKAGSYGIQEWLGVNKIQAIEGCYYNIMGLPCARLYEELQRQFPEALPFS